MKTHSRILSGQLRLAVLLFALFLLPIGAAAQAGNSSQDRTQTTNAGITGLVPAAERKEGDLNRELRIRSGGFFLRNSVLSRARVHMVSASSPFAEVMLGNTNSGDYLTFYSGGSERARIATNGNVGIGTTDPTTPLTNAGWGGSGLTIGNTNSGTTSSVVLVSNPASSYSSLRFGSGTSGVYDQGFVVYDHSANFMSFGTSRGTRMTIDAGGNVGVGTTAPYTRLHVSTTTDADGIVIANPTATNGTRASLYLSTENSTPALGNVSVEAVSVSQAYPDMVFRTLGLNAVNAIGTERMRITSSGNVGIGTPSPLSPLHVKIATNDTFAINGHASLGDGIQIISLNESGSTAKGMEFVGSSYYFRTGYVGIGTTTPGYKLDVNGTVNATGLNINGSPITTSQWSTGSSGINFTSGNVGIGTSSPQRTLDLGTSGQLTFGNNGYTSSGSPGLFWYLDNTNYGIYKTAGSWSAPNYQQLMLNFDTGVVIDGGSAYGKSGTVIQPNAGNVGIGTAAPHYKLDINGATNTNGSTVGIRAYNGEPAMAVFDSAGNQALYSGFVNASNYARIFSYDRGNSIPRVLALNEFGGNVGIGTSGPSTRLHVSTTTDGDGIVISNPTTTNGTRASLYLSTENSTPALGNVSVEAVSVNAAYPDMVFRTAGMNAVNAIGTERMRITSNGNVGIGMPDPGSYKLNVNGAINATGLNINGSPVTGTQWATSGSTISYSAGNVGIGTSAPLTPLHVKGSAGDSFNTAYFTTNGFSPNSYGSVLRVGHAATEGNTYAVIESFIAGGAAFGDLVLNGTAGKVGIGTNSLTAKFNVAGNINVTAAGSEAGNITVAGTVNAKYQDVAEWVYSSAPLSAGTVVVLDSSKSNQVTSSSTSYDTRVAGVISEQPGIALGEKSDGKVLVATTGRVRVKVDATKSPIHIGDLLVTSDVPGLAMKSEPILIAGRQIHAPGTIIGKALEPLAKGKGEILVLLSLQ